MFYIIICDKKNIKIVNTNFFSLINIDLPQIIAAKITMHTC